MTEPPEGPGSWTDSTAGRLVGALVAPAPTFRSIARRPTWVLALVVFTLGFVASQFAVIANSDMQKVRQATVEAMEARGQTVSDEQLAQIEKFQKLGPACSVVLAPIICLVIGLLVMVLANLLGGELSFHGAMGVVTHALMPMVIAYLLTAVVAYAGSGNLDPTELQRSGGLLTSNLAVLAPEGAAPAVVVVLASIDLFQIWALVLMALGVSLAGGLSMVAAGGIVGLLWVLWVGALAALLTAFGGGAPGG